MLDQDWLTLGRDPSNDVEINDPQISRQHARITRQGKMMVIEDLGSTNGTFANGVRLTGPHVMANGDVIGLGDAVTLTYYEEGLTDSTETVVGRVTAAPPPLSYELPSQSPQPPSPPPQAAVPPPPPPQAAAPPPPAYTPAPLPSAAYTTAPPPPPAYTTAPPPAYTTAPPPPDTGKRSMSWLWVGCGLVMLGAIVACLGVFALDYFGLLPSIFYEPLRWLGISF
jgi:predicted component of type VI protein secretion system